MSCNAELNLHRAQVTMVTRASNGPVVRREKVIFFTRWSLNAVKNETNPP